MNEFEVVAQPRAARGTSASRRLRRSGQIPANLYGGGKDPTPLSLEENRIRKQIENEAFAAPHPHRQGRGRGESGGAEVRAPGPRHQPGHPHGLSAESARAARSACTSRCTSSTRRTAPATEPAASSPTCWSKWRWAACRRICPSTSRSTWPRSTWGDSVHLSELALPEGVHLMALVHNPDNDQPVVSGATSAEARGSRERWPKRKSSSWRKRRLPRRPRPRKTSPKISPIREARARR